jgi:hypothetical protein
MYTYIERQDTLNYIHKALSIIYIYIYIYMYIYMSVLCEANPKQGLFPAAGGDIVHTGFSSLSLSIDIHTHTNTHTLSLSHKHNK